jgi:hypothetical protein
MDERGMDYGMLTGIGLAIASAAILLFVSSLMGATAPSNRSIALGSAASEVAGDIATVASMDMPYRAEHYYGFGGMNVTISADRVMASTGAEAFSRPLCCRVVPGLYSENGSLLWNGTAAMREYLNASFNATGTVDSPIDECRSAELECLMEGASRSTLLAPVEVCPGRPFVIKKELIYTYNSSTGATEAAPYVFVHGG